MPLTGLEFCGFWVVSVLPTPRHTDIRVLRADPSGVPGTS